MKKIELNHTTNILEDIKKVYEQNTNTEVVISKEVFVKLRDKSGLFRVGNRNQDSKKEEVIWLEKTMNGHAPGATDSMIIVRIGVTRIDKESYRIVFCKFREVGNSKKDCCFVADNIRSMAYIK